MEIENILKPGSTDTQILLEAHWQTELLPGLAGV